MKNREKNLNVIFYVWMVIVVLMGLSCGEKASTKQLEYLNRGVVAVRETPEATPSWQKVKEN